MAIENSGFLPGAAQHAPLLEQFAVTAGIPPENFIGNIIMPDVEVPNFIGLAPLRGNEALEAYDDDTIGLKTDLKEIRISQGEHRWEMGHHGRKVIIGQEAMQKAELARDAARGAGSNPGADPLFDLESMFTNILVAQHERHNELLKVAQIINPDNYPEANVFDPIEIDTTTLLRRTLVNASKRVEAAGQGPANVIAFSTNAIEGADVNENLLDLLAPEDDRIITREMFIKLMRLPEGSAQVLFSSATYKKTANSDPVGMMDGEGTDGWIWVGRVNPSPDGRTASFGWNRWHPTRQNRKRLYINRLVTGNIENVHIGVQGYYRPDVVDGSLGVLIPTTRSA